MKNNLFKILVITPTKHISNLNYTLEKSGDVSYLEDPTYAEVCNIIKDYDAIFTNPNKSKVFIDKKIMDLATNLKVICTASTGTNHIDKEYAQKKKIKILSLTEQRKIINSISSTAEHAFSLTLSLLRNVTKSYNSVLSGEWDYTKFIGRQFNFLKIGVIGFGRLGKLYAKYCNALGAEVIIFDPYQNKIPKNFMKIDSLKKLVSLSDVISLHVHINKETKNMINRSVFNHMKQDVLIINTSRAEIINENDLLNFLSLNPKAKLGTDVIHEEIFDKKNNSLINYAKNSANQVLITPHIGGMTFEAQKIAYNHAANMMRVYFSKRKR